jgi:hypothetical protein
MTKGAEELNFVLGWWSKYGSSCIGVLVSSTRRNNRAKADLPLVQPICRANLRIIHVNHDSYSKTDKTSDDAENVSDDSN